MFAEWDFLFIAHTPSFTFFGRRVGFVVKVVGILPTDVFRCVERRTKSRTKGSSSSVSAFFRAFLRSIIKEEPLLEKSDEKTVANMPQL